MMFCRLIGSLLIGVILLGSGMAKAAEATEPVQTESHLMDVTVEQESGAAEHAEHEGGGGPLDFKKDLAIWTAVVFLVLMAVLWKFAWGPICSGLEKREQGIAEQIAQAEQSNRDAKELLGQYEQKLAESKAEVRGILDKARQDAEELGREMLEKAREDARAQQQRALEQIDTATANALKELASQSSTLAVELAGKILRAELKPEDHSRLIQQAVAGFGQKGPPGGEASRN